MSRLSQLYIKRVMRLALSLSLIVLVLRNIEWGVLLPVLGAADLRAAVIASCLTPAMVGLLGLRWVVFLRAQRLQLPLGLVIRLTWAGQFFNSVLPGSIGGDAVKLYEICQRFPTARAQAASTVILDRLSALIALGGLALVAFLQDHGPVSTIGLPRVPTVAILGALLFLLLGVFGLTLVFGKRLVDSTRVKKIASILVAVTMAVRDMRSACVGIFMSCGIHCLNFYIVYLFASALGYRVTYGQILLMMPVVLSLLLLPVTINGHGLREVLFISYFTHFGIVPVGLPHVGFREAAVALSLVLVANELIWVSIGGGAYLLSKGGIGNALNLVEVPID